MMYVHDNQTHFFYRICYNTFVLARLANNNSVSYNNEAINYKFFVTTNNYYYLFTVFLLSLKWSTSEMISRYASQVYTFTSISKNAYFPFIPTHVGSITWSVTNEKRLILSFLLKMFKLLLDTKFISNGNNNLNSPLCTLANFILKSTRK